MCPDTNGTDVLYTGIIAGSNANQAGGGANMICLSDDGPEYLEVDPGVQDFSSFAYGAEYRFGAAFGDLFGHNAPCVSCFTAERGAKVMIPGVITCPASWTEEYHGYLMSTGSTVHQRTVYECFDMELESIPGTEAAVDDRVPIRTTETRCDGTACPGYVEGNELTCVVCTK